MLPDADVVGLYLGVPYGHPAGHRGFSHSLLFAVLTGALVAAFWRRFVTRDHHAQMLLVYFSVVTAFNGLLDALTNGGTGVGFFIPFDSGRYFSPTGQSGWPQSGPGTSWNRDGQYWRPNFSGREDRHCCLWLLACSFQAADQETRTTTAHGPFGQADSDEPESLTRRRSNFWGRLGSFTNRR